MKSPYVADLQANQMVTAIFLVQAKDIRQKKTGEPYLSLILGDRTGDLDAKMWDNAEEVLDLFERDDFIKVRGVAQIHHNRLQLSIQKLQKADERNVDYADFFPASKRNCDEMFQEMRGIFQGIVNPHLKTLCSAFLDDESLAISLKQAPAAKSMHHAYLGGLLEHMLSMCHMAKSLGSHYKLDVDLLLTGVLLHDIGKTRELSYDRSFGYTAEGHLIGHIPIGFRMLGDKVRDIPGFPERLRLVVEHLILSHHGELEYGSPREPAFPEALLLHMIDQMDSKMEAMRYSLERDRSIDGFITGYCPALERSVFKKDKFLLNGDEQPPKDAAPQQQPAQQQQQPPVNRPSGPQQSRPRPVSPFAEQLQQALKKENS